MIKVIAQIHVERSCRQEFSDAALRCVELSRGEPGVIRFKLWKSIQDDCCFIFDELFRNEAAMESHLMTEHIDVFSEVAKRMATQFTVDQFALLDQQHYIESLTP